MSWARLDDAILDNPKIIAAGPLGLLLHVAAITWCARNLTDGLIPKRKVRTLVAGLDGLGTALTAPPACGPEEDQFLPCDADEIAEALAAIGLWHDRGSSWELHDYLVYNPPREKVLADREKGRLKKAQQRVSPGVSPGDSLGDTIGIPRCPVPVPVPGSEPLEPKKLAIARKERARETEFQDLDYDLALARQQGCTAPEKALAAFRAHALAHNRRLTNWKGGWLQWCLHHDARCPCGAKSATGRVQTTVEQTRRYLTERGF